MSCLSKWWAFLLIFLENDNQCKDTIYDSIKIFPKPVASFNSNIYSGCEDLAIKFGDNTFIQHDNIYDNGSSYISQWNWDFNNDGIIDSTWIPEYSRDSIEHIYTTTNGSSENFTPSLNVVTDNGCESTYFGNIITVHPTPTAVIYPYPTLIENGLYEFNGSTSFTSAGIPADPSIFNFIWTIDTSTIPYSNNIIEYQFQANTEYTGELYDAYLRIVGDFGCESDTCIETLLEIDYWKTLNVPNSMNPDYGTKEGSVFLPKGIAIEQGTYKLQIFHLKENKFLFDSLTCA